MHKGLDLISGINNQYMKQRYRCYTHFQYQSNGWSNINVKGSGKRLTSDSLVYAQLGLSNPDEELRKLLYIFFRTKIF